MRGLLKYMKGPDVIPPTVVRDCVFELKAPLPSAIFSASIQALSLRVDELICLTYPEGRQLL